MLSLEQRTELFLWLAKEQKNIGQTDAARKLYERVRANSPNEFRRADSLRLLADLYLYSMRNGSLATKACEELLSLLENTTNSTLLQWRNDFFEGATLKGAEAAQLAGKPEKSIELRNRYLAHAKTNAHARHASTALYENARVYAQLGNRAKAIETYDEMLARFPDYGATNGANLNIRWQRIAAMSPDAQSDKRLNLLLEIWQEEKWSKYSQYYTIGNEIALLYARRKAPQLEKHLWELLEKEDKNRDHIINFDPARRETFNSIYKNGVVLLADLYGPSNASNGPAITNLLALAQRRFPDDVKLLSYLERAQRGNPVLEVPPARSGRVMLVVIMIAALLFPVFLLIKIRRADRR